MKKNSYLKSTLRTFCFIFALLSCFIIVGCGNDTSNTADTWEQFGMKYTYEKIGNTNWEVQWSRYVNSKNEEKWEVFMIGASYSENERTSEYYKQLANYHGDNSVYVTHLYILQGTPLEEGWYKIEQTEKITSGWDENYIFSLRTIRYEEKIILTKKPTD